MKKVLQQSSLLLTTILFAVISFAGVAAADDVAAVDDVLDDAGLRADVSEDIDNAPGYEDPKDRKRNWTLSLGLSGGISPDYEGSNDYESGFGPNFAGSWKGILFFKGKTLSANVINEKNFKVGPLLAWTSGRDDDDNDKLEGLDDVDSSIEAGGFISYRKKPWRFRMEVRQDINSGHEGALVEMSAGTTLPFNKPIVFAALGTTLASDASESQRTSEIRKEFALADRITGFFFYIVRHSRSDHGPCDLRNRGSMQSNKSSISP